MGVFLSIITPTFNRADLLKNCYNSLINQSNKDFEWIIVDDGSNDNTAEVATLIKKENLIKLIYIYKENGGKHTALNQGIKKSNGKLVLILDSDDNLPLDCVEVVGNEWIKYEEDKEICGMSFLKSYTSGHIIGQQFPKDYYVCSYIDCRINQNIQGDKCEVFITDILKRYPFPEFENEKFIGEHIVWIKIGRKYKTAHINKSIYNAEYIDGGLTSRGRKLRIESPYGGMISSNECLTNELKLKVKVKNAILYNTYSYFSNLTYIDIYNKVNNKILFILMRPIGRILFILWNRKYNKAN